jgi:hypothetical protein
MSMYVSTHPVASSIDAVVLVVGVRQTAIGFPLHRPPIFMFVVEAFVRAALPGASGVDAQIAEGST